MKHSHSLFGAFIILSLSGFVAITTTQWKVKEDYSVKCGDGSRADGIFFKGLKADIVFDEEHPEKSKITASVNATPLTEKKSDKSAHAKLDLESDKFPLITFSSTAIKRSGSGKGDYEASGQLTLKGITKQIKFPFHFDSQNATDKFPFVFKETFHGVISIAPKDFGIPVNEGEQINVDISVPVTK
jgi:polyisoprenoid-binding protein YceI